MSGSDTGEGELSGEDGRSGRVLTAEVCRKATPAENATKHLLDDMKGEQDSTNCPANVRGNPVDIHLMHAALWPQSSSLVRFRVLGCVSSALSFCQT